MTKAVALLSLLMVMGCSRVKAADQRFEVGRYKIVKAYALIHDNGQATEVSSELFGLIVEISNALVTIRAESHSITERKWISQATFSIYHAGINYEGMRPNVFGAIDKDEQILLLRLGGYGGKNLIGGNVYYAHGRVLLDAVREYADKKDWSGDMYFYLAEKI